MRLCLPRGSESGVFYCYRDRSSAVSMMHLWLVRMRTELAQYAGKPLRTRTLSEEEETQGVARSYAFVTTGRSLSKSVWALPHTQSSHTSSSSKEYFSPLGHWHFLAEDPSAPMIAATARRPPPSHVPCPGSSDSSRTSIWAPSFMQTGDPCKEKTHHCLLWHPPNLCLWLLDALLSPVI